MKSLNALLLSLPLVLGGATAAVAQDGPAPRQEQAQRIEQLIRQLGHPAYAQREAAQQELVKIGRPALAALRKATASDDPEVASRAAEAIAAIGGKPEQTRERETEPEQRRGPEPRLPEPLDPNQLLEGLEKQLPERFGKLFKELFGEDMFGNGQEQQGGTNRVRVWSWGNNGQGGWRTLGGPVAAAGLDVARAGAAMRAQLELPTGTGLVINEVQAGSLASKHGLAQYDVIATLDGRPVRTAEDLTPLLAKGGRVELVRKAKRITLELPALARAEARPAPEPPTRRAPPKPAPRGDDKKERDF